MNYPIEKNVPLEWEPGDVILNLYEVKNITRDFENKNNECHYHEGGFGRVYKVWHRAWNLHMAVKTPKAGMFTSQVQKESFLKECETWINLGLHPHVAACHYVRELGGIPRVFSEYADSGTLAEWIASKRLYEGDNGKVLTRILDFAIQFAWGLHHSHESGVVHQDVKPRNALIFGGDILKVCDFGIAGVKANFSSGGNPRSLDSGYQTIMVKGGSALTMEYCSPEQYAGRELSRKSDIWSWGLSVLEMFTGGVMWISGTAAQQVLEQYLEDEEPEQIIVQMPDKLVNLLRSCFESDPALRPKNMLQCADAILSIFQDDFKTKYVRIEPAPIISTPAAFNNRGLSLIDLGKNKEAMEALQQAFASDSSDREAIYNYSLFRWRNQQISDNQFIESLSSISIDNSINEQPFLELGLANYEMGFFEDAVNYFSDNFDHGYRNRISAFYYHKSILSWTRKFDH
jgi:serine/threonine protein kinase